MTHDLDTEERYRPDPAWLEQQQVMLEMQRLLANMVPPLPAAALQQQSMYDAALRGYWCQPMPWYARWWSPW